jgi:hypothetical protein
MKKYTITIFLFFVVLLQSNLYAQENEETKFVPEHLIGITGGMNMVSIFSEGPLSYKDAQNNDIVSSLYLFRKQGGLSYKYISGKNVGLLLDLLYNQKGGYNMFLYDINNKRTDSILFNHQLDYAELAFLTDVRLGKKHGKINLYLGPHATYLLKQNIIILEDTFGNEYISGTNKMFEFGIDIGGGYSFHFNKGEVELRFLYNHDFTNVFLEKTVNNFSFNQNQVYSLSFAYYYKL